MSVLIKGMKMPKGCITCMFKSESLFNRTMWCEWLDDPLGDYTKCDEEWRHPDCPLIEVSTPHGRWIDMDDHVMCSCCGATHYGADKNYCPNCGAKMDLEERDYHE